MRIMPLVIWMVCWSTVVYNIIVYWVWNDNGWARKLGVLDFAGGEFIYLFIFFLIATLDEARC
jgi:Amt family ammonium transporter